MTATDKDPPNLGLLIKLLKMTTSTSDAEALSAMRKANEQLAKFGGDWERLLLGKVKIIADPFSSIQAPPPARHRQTEPPIQPAPQWTNQRDWTIPNPPPKPAMGQREAEARRLEAEMRERVKLQRAKDVAEMRRRTKERLRAQAAKLNLDDLDIQF